MRTRRRAKAQLRRAARTTLIGAILVATTLLTAACQKRQEPPSLPTAAGFRVDDGALKFWTGTPCERITYLTVMFRENPPYSTEDPGPDSEVHYLKLRALLPGATFEYLNFDDVDPAFIVTKPLPKDFDWRTADEIDVMMSVDPDAQGVTAWGSTILTKDILAGSPAHDADTYLFEELGWMNPADIARGNGTDFLTVCTPDPAATGG